MEHEKVDHDQDVISLGDEDEIHSNPSPPNTEQWDSTNEAELSADVTKEASVLAGDSSKPELETTIEHEMSKFMFLKEEDTTAEQVADSGESSKPIEVITLDSSDEEPEAQKPKPSEDSSEALPKPADDTLEFSTNNTIDDKPAEVPPITAGTFGLDVKVEDDQDDEPTRPQIIVPFSRKSEPIEEEEDDDNFEDESISERIYALREMFPQKLRNGAHIVSTGSVTAVKGLYSFSRAAVWVAATSAVILAAPVLIETEKTQIEEMNRQQQRQILLGPGAAQGGMTPNLTQPMRG